MIACPGQHTITGLNVEEGSFADGNGLALHEDPEFVAIVIVIVEVGLAFIFDWRSAVGRVFRSFTGKNAATSGEIVHKAHRAESFRARNGIGARMSLGTADARAEIRVNKRYGWGEGGEALEGMRVVQTVHVDNVWLPGPESGHCGVNSALHGTEERYVTDVDASAIRRSIDLVEKRNVGARCAHPRDDLFKV